jgi:hypothetical protein
MEWKLRLSALEESFFSRNSPLPLHLQEWAFVYLNSLSRDGFDTTLRHSVNTAIMAQQVAKCLWPDFAPVIGLSALMHDKGKTKLNPALFDGSKKITPWLYNEVIKQHVHLAYYEAREIEPVSAWMMRTHHTCRQNGYGDTIRQSRIQIAGDIGRKRTKPLLPVSKWWIAAKIIKAVDYYERYLNFGSHVLLSGPAVGNGIEETLNLRILNAGKIIIKVIETGAIAKD